METLPLQILLTSLLNIAISFSCSCFPPLHVREAGGGRTRRVTRAAEKIFHLLVGTRATRAAFSLLQVNFRIGVVVVRALQQKVVHLQRGSREAGRGEGARRCPLQFGKVGTLGLSCVSHVCPNYVRGSTEILASEMFRLSGDVLCHRGVTSWTSLPKTQAVCELTAVDLSKTPTMVRLDS